MSALIERIETIALNIIRVTLEDGAQFTIQELDGQLYIVPFNKGSK